MQRSKKFGAGQGYYRAGIIAAMLILAACAPDATAIPIPTLTLILATDTPTPTTTPLPTLTANVTEPAPLLASTLLAQPSPTSENGVDTTALRGDPVAEQLIVIAQRQVAETLDLPLRRVRLTDVQPYTWTDTSLGCPLPEVSYSPIETTGYRILLEAGDTTYLFHTDVDRIVPCDPANEQLPSLLNVAETTDSPTPETTRQAVG